MKVEKLVTPYRIDGIFYIKENLYRIPNCPFDELGIKFWNGLVGSLKRIKGDVFKATIYERFVSIEND